MKKNEIKAFSDKKAKLDNITGGWYFEQTVSGGGNTVNDSQYVTEKGERDPNTGDVVRYDTYDAKLCKY